MTDAEIELLLRKIILIFVAAIVCMFIWNIVDTVKPKPAAEETETCRSEHGHRIECPEESSFAKMIRLTPTHPIKRDDNE